MAFLFLALTAAALASPEIPTEISHKPLPFGLTAEAPTSCRAHIENILCMVDPVPPEEREEEKPRVCLEGGKAHAHFFEELHDHFPPVLQKVFCSLDVIYIEKDFAGTAYAGTTDEGLTMMGIRKSVLDEGLDLKTWSSWKEQLNFGGAEDSYRVSADLPETFLTPVRGVNDFLYFVVAHEFGHVLDFANLVNETDCPPGHDGECKMKEGTWGAISWATNEKPKPGNDFLDRTKLCFYWCSETIDPLGADRLYRDLAATEFLSTYATTQPWDDFADSLAYFLVDRYLGQSYVLDTKLGMRYDTMEKLHSPVFAGKYRYLEEFLSRKDLKYP